MAMTSSLLPLKYSLFLSLMRSTELHSGTWNFLELVLSTYDAATASPEDAGSAESVAAAAAAPAAAALLPESSEAPPEPLVPSAQF